MRILDISPRMVAPPRRGAAARSHYLARCLSERHEVRQFCQARLEWGRTREIPVTPTYRILRYASPLAVALTEVSERAWVRSPILAGRALAVTRPAGLRRLLDWADGILVEFPWQFGFVRRAAPDRPLVYNAHNVERQKFESWAEASGHPLTTKTWLRAVERAEAAAVADADLILTVSAEDRRGFVERYGVGEEKVVEIPNGADTERYLPAGSDERTLAKRQLGLPDRPIALFAGSDMPPNRRGLDWVRRIAERDGRFTFVVVGGVARPARRDNVIATGLIDDVRPYFAAADVSLCPIEHGGGTKIKLLESLAAGLPVVAFPEALAGTAFRPDEHVLCVEKDVDAMVQALACLAGDEQLRARLGSAGRELVRERYDWREIARRLEQELLLLTVRYG